jgi:hypothetical protein
VEFAGNLAQGHWKEAAWAAAGAAAAFFGGAVLVKAFKAWKAAKKGQPLYRGVPGNLTPKAILGRHGIAIPRGTALDEASLTKHVLGGDVNAGVTSWTTDRNIARQFSGANGTIIEVDLSKVSNRVVPRPPVAKYAAEHEVLLKDIIKGTPTKP